MTAAGAHLRTVVGHRAGYAECGPIMPGGGQDDMDGARALLVGAAIAAGAVIESYYRGPRTGELKGDGSPVTEADRHAEAIILARLADTGLPVLAEESVAAGIVPTLGERYFIVDPLDGTKEFIKGNGEFTVNIASIERGRPVLGVVLAPALGRGYFGGPDGAWTFTVANGLATHWQRLRSVPSGALRIVASRSHGHAALAELCQRLDVESDVSVGSSLKFCLVAQGDAQLYPRFTPTSEWDTAAGQAVLEAAGGVVLTLDGEPLAYGKAERGFLNPFFIAASSLAQGREAAEVMRGLVGDL